MANQVRAVPEGYEGASPYLCVKGAARALEFYKKAFGAQEIMCLAEPSGRVGHAEIRVGKAIIMLSDEYPEMGILSPTSLHGTPVSIHLYVEDVDARVRQAEAAGARVIKPVADQFYGDRTGKVLDPFGHVWHFATRKQEISPQEMQQRFTAMMQQPKGA